MLAKLMLVITPVVALGAIDYGGHPSSCQSRPCVYTISCAGSPRTGVVGEIQTAVNDAHRGDTIRLEAGCKWSSSAIPAVWIQRDPPGSSGRVLITSTESAKLPAPGTRITPVYRPLMPRLEYTGTTGPFIAFASAWTGTGSRIPGVSATHWELRGIDFWMDKDTTALQSLTNGYIRIGDSGGVASKAGGHWTKLTVASNAAEVTTAAAHGFLVGDKIRVEGLTGTAAALMGVQTITSVPTTTTFRFAAPGMTDGTYTESTMYYAHPADTTQLPNDIVINQCIFAQGGLSKIVRDIYLNSGDVTIKDSWISSARTIGGQDSQLITGLSGAGPVTIHNNYMGGAFSEGLIFGGSATAVGNGFENLDIRYNYLAHPPWEARTRIWRLLKSDGDPVLRGRIVKPTVANGFYFIARNTGVIGSSEPTWCSTLNCTVTDGTVTWEAVSGDGNATWSIKNNFELKAAKDASIFHNVFEYMWAAAQVRAINIKSEQQSLYPNFGNNCVPTLSGTVNTNGQIVTAVSGTFPWMANTVATYGTDPKAIHIGGVVYTISSFDSAGQLTLTTSAGTQSNVPFRYGTDPAVRFCQAALTQNINMSHNIVRNTLSPLVVNPGTNAHRGLTGGFKLRHNLFERTDPVVWGSENGGVTNAAATLFFTPIVSGFVADHNTFLSSNTPWAVYADNSSGTSFPGDSVFTNNIFGKHTSGVFRSGEHAALASLMCGGSTCPPSQWSNNVLLGANVSGYSASPGYVANLCPSAAACASPQHGSLFHDLTGGDYRVKGNSAFARAATDGSDYGADPAMLPRIDGLTVQPTDRLVVFRYRVTQPISHIPCVVEVSTMPDFSVYGGELGNIAAFYRQDSDNADRFPRDGLQRTITIGHSVPLTAGTLHYYRLHCGGDVRTGTFSTVAALSGVEARSLTFRSTSPTVQTFRYGYEYSRANRDITDARTEEVSCAVDLSCSVTYTVNRGKVLYWQMGSSPVQAEAVR